MNWRVHPLYYKAFEAFGEVNGHPLLEHVLMVVRMDAFFKLGYAPKFQRPEIEAGLIKQGWLSRAEINRLMKQMWKRHHGQSQEARR